MTNEHITRHWGNLDALLPYLVPAIVVVGILAIACLAAWTEHKVQQDRRAARIVRAIRQG